MKRKKKNNYFITAISIKYVKFSQYPMKLLKN